jgi:hypothetical protein
MSTGKLKELAQFWADNGLSKTQYYYLQRLGRAPKTIPIGTKKLVAPEAEDEWRREMAARPVVGNLRKLALAVEAA